MKQRKQRAVGFTVCPVNGCTDSPMPLFCPMHWTMVSSIVRRQLVLEMTRMVGRGTGDLSVALSDVLKAAVRDVKSEEYGRSIKLECSISSKTPERSLEQALESISTPPPWST